MSWALWSAAATVAIVYTLTLRLSIRLMAKDADNGWDNALGYGVVTILMWVPLKGIFEGHHWALMSIFPLMLWLGQTFALKWIYELRTMRAWGIGLLHGIVSGTIITGLTITAGAVAAYLLYGRIVSDPMWLISLVLRLIGIELPF
jgi:hypothetical protein